MIRVSEIKIPVGKEKTELGEKIKTKLGLPFVPEYFIKRKSIDARKKEELCYSYTVDVRLQKKWEEKCLRKKRRGVSKAKEITYEFPYRAKEAALTKKRPVIVGMGPAGLYCGWMLAKAGYRPLLLERGRAMEERVTAVEQFWKNGVLDESCNVQFGEGGAGTFSDGKLNTTVHDKSGRNDAVLRLFVEYGAKEEILYDGKPHIGTDCLREIIINMREAILEAGGEIRFSTQVTGVDIQGEVLKGLWLNEKEYIDCDMAVFAVGHSARDTFSLLYNKGLKMEAKDFAMGVRVEHRREMIHASQYGTGKEAQKLPTAPYKVVAKAENGRNVYSFCMCPGGFVVNASSKQGYLAVNGMSNADRMAENSNSAIVVNVTREDFESDHPLAGVAFQEKWEREAYSLCHGKIPVQKFEDFCRGKVTKEFGSVKPCMKGEYAFGNIRNCLPEFVSEAIIDGMKKFERQIAGFSEKDTLLSGIESRTSSPLRVVRNKEFESNILGIFPCGEGAGYAGGITSAAIDGIRVAEEIARRLNGEEKKETTERKKNES